MELGEHLSFAESRCCSKCGRPLDAGEKAGLVVGLKTLSGDGAQIHITTREQQIVEELLKNYPNLVLHERMFLNVWGASSDAQMKTMHVFICRLRKKLKQVGFDIATSFGAGYRLIRYVA